MKDKVMLVSEAEDETEMKNVEKNLKFLRLLIDYSFFYKHIRTSVRQQQLWRFWFPASPQFSIFPEGDPRHQNMEFLSGVRFFHGLGCLATRWIASWVWKMYLKICKGHISSKDVKLKKEGSAHFSFEFRNLISNTFSKASAEPFNPPLVHHWHLYCIPLLNLITKEN